MSLWEFNIRSVGHRRQEQKEWAKFRRVAYAALIGSHQDPKRLPKREEQYFKLDMVDVKPQVSQKAVDRFLEQVRLYEAEKKVRNGE